MNVDPAIVKTPEQLAMANAIAERLIDKGFSVYPDWRVNTEFQACALEAAARIVDVGEKCVPGYNLTALKSERYLVRARLRVAENGLAPDSSVVLATLDHGVAFKHITSSVSDFIKGLGPKPHAFLTRRVSSYLSSLVAR